MFYILRKYEKLSLNLSKYAKKLGKCAKVKSVFL
jgi:hypothetical protein